MDACKEQNVQEPIWNVSDSYVKTIFARNNSESTSYEDKTDNKTDSKTDNKTTSKPTTKYLQAKVKAVLLNGEKSIQELMSVCGYKDRDSFRKSILNELIEKGSVGLTHPENPNHRNQKYYLKEIGKKAKQNT